MIYIFDKLDFSNEILEKSAHLLDRDRHNKVHRYKFIKDKVLSCMAFVLLRYALFSEYDISSIPTIESSKNGKPYIKNSSIKFNISHCDNAVLCSVSENETGCDIQNYTPKILNVKNNMVSETEKQNFNDIRALTRLWTLKEAYGKYLGCGMRYNFKDTDFSSIDNIEKVQKFKDVEVISCEYKHYAFSCFGNDNMVSKKIQSFELNDYIEKTRL